MNKPIPVPVQEMVNRMVRQAINRCEREGITLEDFHAAMILEQQEAGLKDDVPDLLARTFKRLESKNN